MNRPHAFVAMPFGTKSGPDGQPIDFNRVYAGVAREPFEHWELPDGGHTAAIRERPLEYERRVIDFFDEALGAEA